MTTDLGTGDGSRLITVGAYPVYVGDPALVAPVVTGLADSTDVGGLELPWQAAGLIPEGAPDHWRHTVTCIPATMTRLGADPVYGLASADAEGRRRAVAELAEVRDGVARLGGRIRAVEVHSAPRRSGTAEALAASLAELAAWHWCGATLVVEHCDAWRDDDTAQKGFLPFADELDVVAAVDGQTPVRIGINWARSVIESHDPAAPERQLEAAVARGLLGALMFSSVSDRPTAFGPAWLDAHLAPADTTGAEPGTLLTEARLRRCVQALSPAFDGVLGVKVGLKPDTLAAADRVSRLLEVVALVVEARR